MPYANLGNPQSLNLYAYVNNNPLARTDPDGHLPSGCVHGLMGCLGNYDPFDLMAVAQQNNPGPAFNTWSGVASWALQTDQSVSGAFESALGPPDIKAMTQAQYDAAIPVIAKQLEISEDEVRSSIHLAVDDNGNYIVRGGHANLTVDEGSDAVGALSNKLGSARYDKGQGSELSRLGGLTPSVHLDNGLLHVDRFNAGAYGYLGVVPHFFYDVVLGSMSGNVPLLPY